MQNALQPAGFSDPARHGGLRTHLGGCAPGAQQTMGGGARRGSPRSGLLSHLSWVKETAGDHLSTLGARLGELPFSQPAAMFTEAREAAGGIGKTAPLDGSRAPRMPTVAGHGHTPSALSEQKKEKAKPS